MFFLGNGYNLLRIRFARRDGKVNQGEQETQEGRWTETHPWLVQTAESEEEDSVGEVIRYTLDELRLA